MSSFFIFNIACIARCDFAGSEWVMSSGRMLGTICHDTPNLSFS